MAAAGFDLEVLIEEPGWTAAVGDAPALCQGAAAAAWAMVAPSLPWSPNETAEACLVLASDERVRALNREFRGRDEPTDVLSFPAFDTDVLAAAGADMPPLLLGDIIIALQTTLADAKRDGKPAADHLRHLVVHGILHLLGHDHQQEDAAADMEALEARILAGLGIADPYGAVDQP